MGNVYIDPAWVYAAQQGDQSAITLLYNRTYQNVYLTIKSMIKNDEDTVYDVLQDTYLKAFARLGQLGQPEKFNAWVKGIARNAALDELRKNKPMLFSEMANDAGDNSPESWIEDTNVSNLPEIQMDQQETVRLIRAILDSLPEGQRLVVSMYYYQGMKINQISNILGLSPNTVSVQLRNGRKSIEKKVYELEQTQGIKLYSLSPVAFLLLLLRNAENWPMQPNPGVLSNLLQSGIGKASVPQMNRINSVPQKGGYQSNYPGQWQNGASAGVRGGFSPYGSGGQWQTGASAGATAGVGAAGGAAGGAAVKIVAGVVAGALVLGGTAGVVAYRMNHKAEPEPEPVVTESVVPTETEEVVVETEEVVETTEPVEEGPSTQEKAYAAYAQVYSDLLTQYGDYQQKNFAVFGDYIGGVFYAGLMDFTGDDLPELVLAYEYTDGTSSYPHLSVGIWSWDEASESAVRIYQPDNETTLPYHYTDYSSGTLVIAQNEGSSYLVEAESPSYFNFLAWNGTEFVSEKSFEAEGDTFYSVDGQSVSWDTYNAAFTQWEGYESIKINPQSMGNPNSTMDVTAATEMVSSAQQAIASTKEALGMAVASETTVNGEEAYAELLDAYGAFIRGEISQNDNALLVDVMTGDLGDFPVDANGYYISDSPLYYCITDLNGDDIDELLITDDIDELLIIDDDLTQDNIFPSLIYTLKNGEPVLLAWTFYKQSSWVCNDGTIGESVHGFSVAGIIETYCEIWDGELVSIASCEGESYYLGAYPCTEAEYQAFQDAHPAVTLDTFQWTQFN